MNKLKRNLSCFIVSGLSFGFGFGFAVALSLSLSPRRDASSPDSQDSKRQQDSQDSKTQQDSQDSKRQQDSQRELFPFGYPGKYLQKTNVMKKRTHFRHSCTWSLW